MPLSRVAALRVLVFAFVIVDVVLLHTSGWYHGYADPVWYEPLVMGKVLHLPAATVLLVQALKWGCVLAALAAMTGRAPRLLGWTVAVGWVWYQYVAFSYGKVDHDRADFVVALALLPTVGLAHLSDQRRSEAAGFALRARPARRHRHLLPVVLGQGPVRRLGLGQLGHDGARGRPPRHPDGAVAARRAVDPALVPVGADGRRAHLAGDLPAVGEVAPPRGGRLVRLPRHDLRRDHHRLLAAPRDDARLPPPRAVCRVVARPPRPPARRAPSTGPTR